MLSGLEKHENFRIYINLQSKGEIKKASRFNATAILC